MTRLLEEAFAAAARLPEAEQEAFAAWILEELATDERWDRSFAASADLLATLADDAIAEYRRGETQALELDAP